MADINSLSFGCGNTLLANQLNIMADAIRSLITLVENIDDQVGSYIPLSGSENITGVLAPDTNEGYDLGKSNNRWGTVWASTGGFKTIDFYDLQTPFGKLGELYLGKDTSNNNKTILQFKHGNNNEEIVATRDWVNSLTRINIGSTGSISEELYNDKSNYIKIESSSDNPIVIAGYDENSLPIGIKFGDASTGDVLTVYNEKIYINGDIFGGENGVSVLNDLSNVDTSAARTGWFLMYNGTSWVSNPLPESLIKHPGNVSINEEYYLKYEVDDEHPSGWYSWVERPSGAKELNELNDVEIDDNKLELGQVLVYSQVTDGEHNTCNSWVNKTVSGVLTYNQSDHDKYLKVNEQGTGTEWVDGTTAGVSSINSITGAVTITGSGVSTNNNTITITGGGLTSGSWANYLNEQTKDDNNLSDGYLYYTSSTGMSTTAVAPGSGLLWSDLTNSSDNIINPSHLPVPNDTLGGIRATRRTDSISILSSTATNNSKYYRVQVQSDGVAFVDVPWVGGGSVTSITVGDGLEIGTGNNPITTSGTIKLPTFNNNNGNSNTSGTSIGPASDVSTAGSTFKVPRITYDKYGRITNATERTITLPSGGTGNGDITGVTVDGLGLLARKMTDNTTDANYTYNHHVTVPDGNVQLKVNNLEVLTVDSLTNLCNAFETCYNILGLEILVRKNYDTTSESYKFSIASPYTNNVPDGTYYISAGDGSVSNNYIFKLVISNNRSSFNLYTVTNGASFYWKFGQQGVKLDNTESSSEQSKRIIYDGIRQAINSIEGTNKISTTTPSPVPNETINTAPSVTLYINN